MGKIAKRILLTVLILLLLVLGVYLGLAYYYQNGFSYGTWINGIYATGKSIEEMNGELRAQYKSPSFSVAVWGKDGKEERSSFDMERFQKEINFTKPLQTLKEKQEPLFWGRNLFLSHNKILQPERSFDLKAVSKEAEEFFERVKIQTGGNSPGIFIRKKEEGYCLEDNTKRLMDTEKAKTFLLAAIAAGENEIVLTQTPCYYDLELTEEMQNTLNLWEKVDAFQSFTFSYSFGAQTETVDESVVSEWILLDENGEFVFDKNGELILDEDKMKEYILSLASKYDTFNGTRQYKTKRGDTVTIEGGTYGNKLNQKKEFAYLKEAFLEKRSEQNRVPEYEKKALYQGSNDIGDTFIEIDMTNQKMYYFVKGKVKIETDIVTGNMARKMSTPARTCFVYAKQKNRILRGPGYASHVNFWMPVNRGIGIHDAKWRKNFGGDIYKTEGSHGCINTPYDIMKELFDMVEIGTPAIMYY